MITDTLTQLLNGTPVDNGLLQTAITTALSRYSQDAPPELMAICNVDSAGVVSLPSGWVQGVSDVIDIEQVFSGSGAGAGSIAAEFNGVPLGSFNTLNVLGSGVDASLVGSTLNVQAPPPSFSISSFTVSPSVLEMGNVSQSVTLSWAYSGLAPTSQTLNGTVLDPALRTLVIDTSVPTFALSASAGSKTATRSAILIYASRVFSGNSTDSHLADLINLVGVLKANASGSYDFTAGAGVYKYIAMPASYAAVNPDTGFIDTSTGFPVSFDTPYSVLITNGYGYEQNYNVYRSFNKLNGAITIRV